MYHSIYIAGAEPGSGKSVVVLGMMEMLRAITPRVGFFRPVISRNEGLDPLIHLVSRRYQLEEPFEAFYGCTEQTAYDLVCEGRQDELLKLIIAKYKAIQNSYDIVICAGTDFTGVSTALELDFNAGLANNFSCLFVPVVKGHGRSAREISDAVILLEDYLIGNRHCEVLAAFVNRVNPANCDDVAERLKSTKIPFYVLPEKRALEKPTVGEIARAMKFRRINGNEQALNNIVNCYQVAAMKLPDFLDRIQDCSLIITPGDRADIILGSLVADASHRKPSIAGLLLTGGQEPDRQVAELLNDSQLTRVPILLSPDDTFETALKVNAVEASILPSDERKIALGLGIMEAHANMLELRELVIRNGSQKMTPLMFEYELIQRAKAQRRHIVLPEGTDERILRAAEILSLREVAQITLLGDVEKVQNRLRELGLKLKQVEIIDPRKSPRRPDFAETYYDLRNHKGVSYNYAYDLMSDVSYFGTMMVHHGHADGMVSGAAHTTQHTILPSFEIIKTQPDCSLISSVFLMCLEDRVLVYGDCAVNPNPDSAQLADIAISSAQTASMFGIEPRIAMLSYSTGESGKGADVEKVRKAVKIARGARPDLKIEGPIQYDAAVDAGVALSKMPGSEVAGKATVFIFPDLNTGNNTYKAVQRSANAVAIGPVIQGLNKPVNDLSRGCTITDIVNTVAITAIQAQAAEQE